MSIDWSAIFWVDYFGDPAFVATKYQSPTPCNSAAKLRFQASRNTQGWSLKGEIGISPHLRKEDQLVNGSMVAGSWPSMEIYTCKGLSFSQTTGLPARNQSQDTTLSTYIVLSSMCIWIYQNYRNAYCFHWNHCLAICHYTAQAIIIKRYTSHLHVNFLQSTIQSRMLFAVHLLMHPWKSTKKHVPTNRSMMFASSRLLSGSFEPIGLGTEGSIQVNYHIEFVTIIRALKTNKTN